MVRPTSLLVTVLLLLAAVGAGLASPAGAAVPNIVPDRADVFTRIGAGDENGVAVGAGGARYVCGYETFATRGMDFSVRRVGATSWNRYWDGAAHGADKAWDIAVSAAGSVYVCGSSATAAGGTCSVVLKYSANGKLKWARRWTSVEGANPTARRIAIDGAGRVVVVGQYKSGPGQHIFVAKYRPDGVRQWLRRYAVGYSTLPKDFCIGSSNTIYVAGSMMPTDASFGDGVLLKYSSGGTLRWTSVYAPLYDKWDVFSAVCRRPAGGVYVAGTSQSSGADSDGIVYRCTAGGARTLITRLGLLDGAYTELYDVAASANGSVIVAGDWETSDTNYNFYVADFTEAGAKRWEHAYDSGLGYDRAELLAVDANGGVTASGFFASGGGNKQVATFFFAPSGAVRYRNLWAGLLDGDPVARDIAVRGTTVWIAGQSPSMTEGDGFLLRFRP